MIEVRKLTEEEFNTLISEAPKSETDFIRDNIINNGINAYEYFSKNSFESSGIIIDQIPIYFAVILLYGNEFTLWTVVNKDVKEQFSLYKISKRELFKWIKKYKRIYATMQKINLKNIEWTKKLGFKVLQEDENIIKFILE